MRRVKQPLVATGLVLAAAASDGPFFFDVAGGRFDCLN